MDGNNRTLSAIIELINVIHPMGLVKYKIFDEVVKNLIVDGFGKGPRSRLVNLEERGVLKVARSDEK